MLLQCDLAKDFHWKFIDCSREPEAACFITKKNILFDAKCLFFSNNCLLIVTEQEANSPFSELLLLDASLLSPCVVDTFHEYISTIYLAFNLH